MSHFLQEEKNPNKWCESCRSFKSTTEKRKVSLFIKMNLCNDCYDYIRNIKNKGVKKQW